MQITPNNGSGPVSRNWPKATPPASGATSSEGASFDGAAALNRALADTPDLRADQVERARLLIGNVNYPPAQTIRRIASLLASHLGEKSTNQ